MPLRFIDNGSIEPWEVTLSAGKIAQRHVEAWRDSLSSDIREDVEEEMNVMAGRIVAVITRLDELEEELLKRCAKLDVMGNCVLLGVPAEEMDAWHHNTGEERIENAAAAIDAACLFDEQLRNNRARAMFAMFLHELEGPGLRRNNVVLPCMDVDFLGEKEWEMLFGSSDVVVSDTVDDNTSASDNVEEPIDSDRPSLHPLAIEAIEESFRLRAKNMTTSPLRIIDAQTEWYDVQYSAMKFADRFLQQHSKPNADGFQWTQEELETIGGRIVGVLMRMDDLEWEWHNRVTTSPLGQIESPTRVPDEQWKVALGLHPGVVEQVCFRTVDEALLESRDFARKRAEMMYALFLMNIEEPALKASGNKVPGGSLARDFIDDLVQLELMMPRLKK